MRELWLIKGKHKIDYKICKDDEQLQQILKDWFDKNYTLRCEDRTIGYPRRKLLEEAMTLSQILETQNLVLPCKTMEMVYEECCGYG